LFVSQDQLGKRNDPDGYRIEIIGRSGK